MPNPFPMAYGVVATDAQVINALKRRPLSQNVGVSLHDRTQWSRVAHCLDLPPAAVDAVEALLTERLTVLAPLANHGALPSWVAPAVRDGYLAAFNGWWAATAELWRRFPRLYGSSANVTGQPPAASAAQARAMFGTDCVVVDAAGLDGPSAGRSASTMVRLDPAGRLGLVRSGAQDAGYEGGSKEFLRNLATRMQLRVAPIDPERAFTAVLPAAITDQPSQRPAQMSHDSPNAEQKRNPHDNRGTRHH